jgi:hypothetical protein
MLVFNPVVSYICCVLFNDAVGSSEYLMSSSSTKCFYNPYYLSVKYSQLLRSVPFFICSVYVPHFASVIHLIFIGSVVDVAYYSANDIKALCKA